MVGARWESRPRRRSRMSLSSNRLRFLSDFLLHRLPSSDKIWLCGADSRTLGEVFVGHLRISVCLFAFSTLAVDVRADMSRLVAERTVMIGFASRTGGATVDTDARGFSTGMFDSVTRIDSAFRSWPSAFELSEQPVDVPTLTIPPSPSSLKLFLSGMLAIGAWHGVRAGRQIAIGALPLPEWYHDGCPAQIGSATPFDLDFSNPPLRRFCTVNHGVGQTPLRCWFERARSALRKPQFLLATLSDPRGPPFFAA